MQVRAPRKPGTSFSNYDNVHKYKCLPQNSDPTPLRSRSLTFDAPGNSFRKRCSSIHFSAFTVPTWWPFVPFICFQSAHICRDINIPNTFPQPTASWNAALKGFSDQRTCSSWKATFEGETVNANNAWHVSRCFFNANPQPIGLCGWYESALRLYYSAEGPS